MPDETQKDRLTRRGFVGCGRKRQIRAVTKSPFQPSKMLIVRKRKGDL